MYIHTNSYIIGNYNPSVRITTYLLTPLRQYAFVYCVFAFIDVSFTVQTPKQESSTKQDTKKYFFGDLFFTDF